VERECADTEQEEKLRTSRQSRTKRAALQLTRDWRAVVRLVAGRLALRLRAVLLIALARRPGHERSHSVKQPRRVLILKLDEIGDAVLATPFLRELRRALPEAWVVLVTSPAAHPILELCPYVDRIVQFRRRPRGSSAFLTGPLAAMRFGRTTLRKGFDVAVIPRWYLDEHEATFLAYASHARRRVGYSEKVSEAKAIRNRGYDRLLTEAVEDRQPRHEVEYDLALLAHVAGDRQAPDASLELWLSDSDRGVVSTLLRRHGVDPAEPLVALGIGAGHPKRSWPGDRFAAIGAWMREQYGMRALILGGPDEADEASRVAADVGSAALSLVGATTLRESAAVLEHCRLFVGNDSGLMHLAAGVGVPVVELTCHWVGGDRLHANSPIRFGPWGVPSRILRPASACAPCRDGCEASEPHCILQVGVEEVCQAVASLLADEERPGRSSLTAVDRHGAPPG